MPEESNLDPVQMVDPMMSDLNWDMIVATMSKKNLLLLLPLIDAKANKFYNRGTYIRKLLETMGVEQGVES